MPSSTVTPTPSSGKKAAQTSSEAKDFSKKTRSRRKATGTTSADSSSAIHTSTASRSSGASASSRPTRQAASKDNKPTPPSGDLRCVGTVNPDSTQNLCSCHPAVLANDTINREYLIRRHASQIAQLACYNPDILSNKQNDVDLAVEEIWQMLWPSAENRPRYHMANKIEENAVEFLVSTIPRCFGQGNTVRTACTNAKLHSICFFLLCPNRLSVSQQAALAPFIQPLSPPAKTAKAQHEPCNMSQLEVYYADILPRLAAKGHVPSSKHPSAGVRAFLGLGGLGVPRVSIHEVNGDSGAKAMWGATATSAPFNGCNGRGTSPLAALDVMFWECACLAVMADMALEQQKETRAAARTSLSSAIGTDFPLTTARSDRARDYQHSHDHTLASRHRSRSPPSHRISSQSQTARETPTKRPIPGRERFFVADDSDSSDDNSESARPLSFSAPQLTMAKVSHHDSALSLDTPSMPPAEPAPSTMPSPTPTRAYVPPLSLRIDYDKAHTSVLAMYSSPEIMSATIMHRLYSEWIADPMDAVGQHIRTCECDKCKRSHEDQAVVSVSVEPLVTIAQVFRFYQANVRAGDRVVSGVGSSESVAIRVAAAAALALW